MPILRHTSSTLVPSSFCFNAKAIWSSVNLLFLTTCSWPYQAFIMPVVSVTERFRLLGQGHSLLARKARRGVHVSADISQLLRIQAQESTSRRIRSRHGD